MPQGKGTYGSKVGRPSEKKKDVTKVKKAASKGGKITSKEAGASRIANRKKAASSPLASMKKKK